MDRRASISRRQSRLSSAGCRCMCTCVGRHRLSSPLEQITSEHFLRFCPRLLQFHLMIAGRVCAAAKESDDGTW